MGLWGSFKGSKGYNGSYKLGYGVPLRVLQGLTGVISGVMGFL